MALKFKRNFLFFAISLVILIALVLYGNPEEVLDKILQLDLPTVIILILLAIFGLLLRFFRFKFLLDRKFKTNAIQLFPLFIFGLSLANVTPGRLAEPLRALILKREIEIPTGYTLACIFLERLSDMLVILTLAILAFIAVKAEIFIIPFLIILIAILKIFIPTPLTRLYFAVIKLIKKILLFISQIVFKKKIKDLTYKLETLLIQMYSELRISKIFIIQIIFAAFIWGGIYSALLYISLLKLGVSISFLSVMGIYALSLIVGLVSFLPGGLGSTEAATTILLTLAGVEYSVALAAAIISRAFSLWDVIILGPICALRIKDKVSEETIKKG